MAKILTKTHKSKVLGADTHSVCLNPFNIVVLTKPILCILKSNIS